MSSISYEPNGLTDSYEELVSSILWFERIIKKTGGVILYVLMFPIALILMWGFCLILFVSSKFTQLKIAREIKKGIKIESDSDREILVKLHLSMISKIETSNNILRKRVFAHRYRVINPLRWIILNEKKFLTSIEPKIRLALKPEENTPLFSYEEMKELQEAFSEFASVQD